MIKVRVLIARRVVANYWRTCRTVGVSGEYTGHSYKHRNEMIGYWIYRHKELA